VSNYNILMNLGGKASSGYAMAALLVAMAVMAIMLSVALPAWSHMIRREKEEELIFRLNQYARAITLYQRKYANASPPNLDALIKERFLRKKFKDPLSPNADGEFQLLYVGSEPGPPGARGRGTGTTSSSIVARTSGPIRGVVSKNTGQSIKTFNGKTRYNEWESVAMQQTTQAGAPAGGQRGDGPPGTGPQRGGLGSGPGGGGGRNPGAPPGGRSGGTAPSRGSPGAPPGGLR
jgi:type II secretory pathway pseudopilin PulG